jgi:UDP:flavonoid glycosyltransferase YjiC (YdhE family)
MRVFLSTYESRGDVEPVVAPTLELESRGAEVRVAAPPDFEELLAAIAAKIRTGGTAVAAELLLRDGSR